MTKNIPVEEGLKRHVSWLIRLRWIAVAGILIFVWFAKYLFLIPLPERELYLISSTIFLYNILFYFYLKRIERSNSAESFSRFTTIQILADWLILPFVMHYTGGIESPVLFYFFFHTIIASILLSPKNLFVQPTAALFLVGAVVILEYKEVIGHFALTGFITGSDYQNPTYLFGVLFFFATALYISTYLLTSIIKKLRERDN